MNAVDTLRDREQELTQQITALRSERRQLRGQIRQLEGERIRSQYGVGPLDTVLITQACLDYTKDKVELLEILDTPRQLGSEAMVEYVSVITLNHHKGSSEIVSVYIVQGEDRFSVPPELAASMRKAYLELGSGQKAKVVIS